MPTDIRSDVGQLLIMGFDGVEPSARLRKMLSALQPGGVILFARNVREPRQTWELLRECQRAVDTPLYTCVDMEGGTVDRLKNIIAPAPAAADVFASGSRELFQKHGYVIGRECATLGFNVDFAPVFDLALPPSRSVMTSRTVSADPEETIVYAREFLRGLKDAHVLGCGKHFPGLGEANLDTHKELPAIDKPWKRLWAEDLRPYRALRREMPFVMVAHAAYPAVTREETPASLSKKWMTDILRKKIGYRGLIISDDLEMGGVLAAASIGDAAVRTIEAGADIYLVCHREEAIWETYTAVLTRAESDAKFARRVRESARRVRRAKQRSEVRRKPVPAPGKEALEGVSRVMWELEEEVRLAKLQLTRQ